MKKKLLICGATGFLGRNILEHYINTDQYDIRAIWHNPTDLTDKYMDKVQWVQSDLTTEHGVKRAFYGGVDILLQYAAVTSGAKDIVSKPYIHVTDNAVINSLLMREAFINEIEHFIFPSCTLMYKSSDYQIKETDEVSGDEIFSKYYGAGNTKVYLEKMCKFYSSFGKTKFSVLRQSNIYGAHDKFNLEKSHVFAATIVKVMEALDSITVWGTGQEKRDLLYVDDLIDCIELVIKNQKSNFELMNVGLGESISIENLVKKIVDLSGKKLYINYDKNKPSIDTKIALDVNKANRLINWTPTTSLDVGIEKTIKWYRENR